MTRVKFTVTVIELRTGIDQQSLKTRLIEFYLLIDERETKLGTKYMSTEIFVSLFVSTLTLYSSNDPKCTVQEFSCAEKTRFKRLNSPYNIECRGSGRYCIKLSACPVNE